MGGTYGCGLEEPRWELKEVVSRSKVLAVVGLTSPLLGVLAVGRGRAFPPRGSLLLLAGVPLHPAFGIPTISPLAASLGFPPHQVLCF